MAEGREPFLIESSSQFRSAGPLPLTSHRYAREFKEVKATARAASTARTADQTHAARYWAENPPATWSRIFRTISAQQRLSLVDNARLYAMLYLTAADALITVWDDKAHWCSGGRSPRSARRTPTATRSRRRRRLAAADRHPAVPGPSVGARGAQRRVRRDAPGLLRDRPHRLDDTNNGGLTRSFTSFSQAIDEVVDARVWSGIHFRIADEQGQQIGRKVGATYRQGRFFRPGKGLR